MQNRLRSTHWGVFFLVGALLLLTTCSKEEPDLTYRVSYSVQSSGSLQVQQIFIVTPLGNTELITGQNSFVQGYRFPPGETVSIRVVGFIIDGTVLVRLRAFNSENEIEKEEPFSASGNSPTSFDIFLETKLE